MPFSKNKERNKEKTVYMLRRDTRCGRCGRELRSGEFIYPTGDTGICRRCAGLDRLMFLPKGSVAVTRRAKRYSSQYAVVPKKSPALHRYERQGILVEARAVRRAREESAADAETRAERRQTAAERRLCRGNCPALSLLSRSRCAWNRRPCLPEVFPSSWSVGRRQAAGTGHHPSGGDGPHPAQVYGV